jgi:hypothetical protein
MDNTNSLTRVELNKFFYYEIVKLLLNVFKKKLEFNNLKVKTLLNIANGFSSINDVVVYTAPDGLFETSDGNFISEIEYDNVCYRLVLLNTNEKFTGFCYNISFIPLNEQQADKEIKDKLLALALNNCRTYSNDIFEVEDYDEYYSINCLMLKKAEVQPKKIENIFIAPEIKEDINRFIYTFKNFRDFEFPMRYLLSGNPGLGKSEIIRAVATSCRESGTILMPKNFSGDFGLLFDLAKMFEPALLCIDDVDLFLGNRDSSYDKGALGEFLTAMDGLVKNKVFVIASTNDKTLVDFAASRPGRFDMVIDFGTFDKSFYLPLVESTTADERIISLFSNEVLYRMEQKKVTGAFIVNLVKQLKVVIEANPAFKSEDLEKMVERSFNGFYGSQLKDKSKFGFAINSQN